MNPRFGTQLVGKIRLLEMKKLNISLKINLWKIWLQIGSTEIERWFLTFCLSLFCVREEFFLENMSVGGACLKIITSGL